MFTSKEFNAFIYTAEERSITQAANRLFLTPPSVCSMVKKLEKRINRSLFSQVDGAMTLTQEGRRLFKSLRPLFYALKDIECQQREDGRNHLLIYLHNDFDFIRGKLTCYFLKKGIKTDIINHERKDADIKITRYDEAEAYDSQIELFFFTACAKKLNTSPPLILADKTKNACWFPQLAAEISQQYGVHEEIIENNADISINMLQEGLGRVCVPELSPQYQLITQQTRLNLVKMNMKIVAGISFKSNSQQQHRECFMEFLNIIQSTFSKKND